MAEVKSTLDLALKRSAGLVLSQEEKARQKAEEEDKKARGLALRLVEGRLRQKDIDREIASAQVSDENRFRHLAAWHLIDQVDLARLGRDRLEGWLRACLGQKADDILGLWDQAASEYRTEFERQAALTVRNQTERLAARGIFGSALRPKPKAELAQAPFKARLKKCLTPA
ncbi:MAG: hypothetical protein JRJ59_11950 [Deltaproteobacteria bacterium]|nr:hypothetical protein [Deltaproteobacteria bacterium]